jgi:nucleotide-binding universal stress UspA family protein
MALCHGYSLMGFQSKLHSLNDSRAVSALRTVTNENVNPRSNRITNEIYVITDAAEVSAMFKKILIPIDGSELALRAADLGVNLAKETSAEVVFLHAIVPYIPPYTAEFDLDGRTVALIESAASQASQDMLDAAEAIAKKSNVMTQRYAETSTRPEMLIDKIVKEMKCDLIVIATHGRGGVGRFFMGSVTTRLLHIATVPVLVYRDQSMDGDIFE